MAADPIVRASAKALNAKSFEYKYYLNFRWMGRPIVQYPQDIVALQEIMWETRPTLVIETGVAHGGSLILYASLLQLMDLPGTVVGVEIELRAHNRSALDAHPLRNRIEIVDGSSVDPAVVARVTEIAQGHERVMVVLDSHHAHEHVIDELRAYAPLVTAGNYLVVFGTSVADLPPDVDLDRPWNSERNPSSALSEWLAAGQPFEVDRELSDRLILSDAPGGYLRRVNGTG